jgi:hypothetical protein
MQQPQQRKPQTDAVKLPGNPGQQQQSKSHQGLHQVDALPNGRTWNAGRVLLWVCKGWWNSAIWWTCFAFALLIWCWANAKENDGGDISGTLHFFIYFARVWLRT